MTLPFKLEVPEQALDGDTPRFEIADEDGLTVIHIHAHTCTCMRTLHCMYMHVLHCTLESIDPFCDSHTRVSADMFEERALLLSRLGRHEVALAIYAHILKEPDKAEE